MKINQKQFSKKLLVLDYLIAGILLAVFFIFALVNGIYTMNLTDIEQKSTMSLA